LSESSSSVAAARSGPSRVIVRSISSPLSLDRVALGKTPQAGS
jgi:hypothetical protein